MIQNYLLKKKSFGLIQGDRVAVLIDSSDANMGFGRAIELQDSLLVNEKIKTKNQNFFFKFITLIFVFFYHLLT
jgi:hypothetical protein